MGERASRRVTIADYLRKVIADSDLSQNRISLDTGISQPSINRFVNRQREISLKTADTLAEYFQLEVRPRRGGGKHESA